MIASANMDSNEGGGNEGVRILLNLPLEEVNSAFAAIPMVHGSPTTVATKFDEKAERTAEEGFKFSWNYFEAGIRTFGQVVLPRLTRWDVIP